ncbi:MAG: hypothetical protein JW863_02825 [Chitinispirillaceae bacterium]|nr:hypothetical protein [Chitinispirillaceae bacterium]
MPFPRPLLPVLTFLWLSTGLLADGMLSHIRGNEDDTHLLNMVIIAEGYTQSEEQLFADNVTHIVSAVFDSVPYKHYSAFFNVWKIFVPSNESGATHVLPDGTTEARDTYFGATYYSSSRVINIDKATVYDILAEHIPDYDLICVLVNDKDYGGAAHGDIAVLSMNISNDPSMVYLHETGHAFAGLADEYESAYSMSPREMYNVTAKTARNEISWRVWILDETPVPTPEATDYISVVGLFEGAMYQETGWYRPMLYCQMRSNYRRFCPVCIEAHIKQIYRHVSPVKRIQPDITTLENPPDTTTLSVVTRAPEPNTLTITWYCDGREAGSGSKLQLSGLSPATEEYVVKAVVRDTTAMVRNPAAREVLADSVSWRVKITTGTGAPVRRRIAEQELSATLHNGALLIRGLQRDADAVRIAVYNARGTCVFRGTAVERLRQSALTTIPGMNMSGGLYFVTVYGAAPPVRSVVKMVVAE